MSNTQRKQDVLKILIKGLSKEKRAELAKQMGITDGQLRWLGNHWQSMKLTHALILIPALTETYGQEAVDRWFDYMSTELLKEKVCA